MGGGAGAAQGRGDKGRVDVVAEVMNKKEMGFLGGATAETGNDDLVIGEAGGASTVAAEESEGGEPGGAGWGQGGEEIGGIPAGRD